MANIAIGDKIESPIVNLSRTELSNLQTQHKLSPNCLYVTPTYGKNTDGYVGSFYDEETDKLVYLTNDGYVYNATSTIPSTTPTLVPTAPNDVKQWFTIKGWANSFSDKKAVAMYPNSAASSYFRIGDLNCTYRDIYGSLFGLMTISVTINVTSSKTSLTEPFYLCYTNDTTVSNFTWMNTYCDESWRNDQKQLQIMPYVNTGSGNRLEIWTNKVGIRSTGKHVLQINLLGIPKI